MSDNDANTKPTTVLDQILGCLVVTLAYVILCGGGTGLCIGLAVFLVRFLWGLGQ